MDDSQSYYVIDDLQVKTNKSFKRVSLTMNVSQMYYDVFIIHVCFIIMMKTWLRTIFKMLENLAI
jgi:hypothetical protein